MITNSVMEIPWDAKGTFKDRPNRFLGTVDITGPKQYKKQNVKVHVHDPGRLKELLYPENQVLLKIAENPKRKTKWDLLAALHEGNWILTNSKFHRHIAEWVIGSPEVSPFKGIKTVKPEARYEDSRLDFLLTKKNRNKIWVEIKGCTLAEDEVALFPDAPTIRGARHIKHLINAKKRGDDSAIIILVFRPDAKYFAPYGERDPEFARVFYEAVQEGVGVYPLLFEYKDQAVNYIGKMPLSWKSFIS